MPFELLCHDDDLLQYREQIRPLIDVQLPLEYLKRCRVVVYRNKNEGIIAGYSITSTPPFRSFLPVPDTNEYASLIYKKSMAELNGIWIKEKYRRGFFAILFWSKMVWDAFAMGQTYYVYSYSSKKEGLEQFLSLMKPIHVWSGNVFVDGMEHPDMETVEMINKKKIIRGMLGNVCRKIKTRSGYQISFFNVLKNFFLSR